MKRMFKTEFYHKRPDKKPIVTMQVRVDRSKDFRELDADGRESLIECLELFLKQIDGFIEDLKILG